MKVSARNVLPATITIVTPGAGDTEVVMELASTAMIGVD
jgi:molybdopterin-binding protein